MSIWKKLTKRLHKKTCILVICIFLPFLLSPLAASPDKETRCSFVIILVVSYWLLEPVSVYATSLLPILLFPMLNIVGSSDICSNYMKESMMVFIAGLLMAQAVEECKLHERIALKFLLLIGTDVKWILLGFMLSTMFLSMWVSNTAATTMMIPIAEAVLTINDDNSSKITPEINESFNMSNFSTTENKQLDQDCTEEISNTENSLQSRSALKIAFVLSICYSAAMGGTGTLTGTGVNIVFKGFLEELYPKNDEITYTSWMMYNVPGMILYVLIGWFYMWMVYVRKSNNNFTSKEGIQDVISKRYAQLGSIKRNEGEVIVLFVILVILWVFRDPKFIPGWSAIFKTGKKISDSVPAMAVVFLLFFLPSDITNLESRPVLDWKRAQRKLPWGVLLMFGGGYALADGAKKSELSKVIDEHLKQLQVLPPFAIVVIVILIAAMLTEVVPNSTTGTILLPLFNEMALAVQMNPLLVMLPVTVACSFAFMLPVSSGATAVAFQSGHMKTADMVKAGFAMVLICIGVQIFMLNTLGVILFDLYTFPNWANVTDINKKDVFIMENETLS